MASEFGILLDKQIGRAEALGAAGSGMAAAGYDRVSPSGVGFRAAYTFLDMDIAELGAAVTYHPKANSNLTAGGNIVGTFGDQYTAIGVQADWKLLLDVHAGLDLRSEKLTSTAAGVSDSTTQTRPWVKAGVGYSLPTPVVSPFVRLEVAVPLSKDDSTSTPDDFRKAMAPTLQVALYGGIRF
jgi:hypothetical protein